MLVCAGTNSACDEIAERLLKVVQNNELYRLYAKSHDGSKVSGNLKAACNLRPGGFEFPSLNFLYQFRVVVTTLSTAGTLVRSRDETNFDSSYFDYVVIDEAACTHQPMLLASIAGLCTEKSEVKC